MKIGVITHWWCFENYGQVLQGYAFQQFLMSRGHEPFIIKYFPGSGFSDRLSLRRALFRLRNIKSAFESIKSLVLMTRYRARLRRNKISCLRDFDGFRAKEMSFTKRVYRSRKELQSSDEINADLYSAGSDVVWKHVPLNDDGRALFLDFGNPDAKRISYSASFGGAEVTPAYRKFVAPLLRRLDQVGVRETSGVRLCSQMGRADARCVVDPVFLLTRDDYRSRFGVSDVRRGVAGYFLSVKNKIPFDAFRSYAKKLGEKLTLIMVYGTMGLFEAELSNPTMAGWIRGIGEAKLLVTNSFHGTSMAIIMHTPFVVFLRGDPNGLDARLISLLGELGLQNRIYDYSKKNFAQIEKQSIDWVEVDAKLKAYIIKSVSFLERIGI